MGESVSAIIPAHNEEDAIANAIRSLLTQSRPPERIIVASDNSTDRTVEIAKRFGPMVDVFESVENRDKKSGVLNQALDHMSLDDDEFVLIVDADTQLSPVWIETALLSFENPDVGAVGGVFTGDGMNGILGHLQGVEYARYGRQLRRGYGKARVLTGTSTISRMGTFREVKRRRESGDFPGRGYYNVDAITEDGEFTICVKRLGLLTMSPKECVVVTETMPTIPELWNQRTRWTIGALDTITMHGLNRVTIPYAARQVEAGIGIVANVSIIFLAIWAVATGGIALNPIWLAIGALFLTERVVSASEYGYKGVAIATTVALDMAYDLFISAVWVFSVASKATTSKRSWGNSSIDKTGA